MRDVYFLAICILSGTVTNAMPNQNPHQSDGSTEFIVPRPLHQIQPVKSSDWEPLRMPDEELQDFAADRRHDLQVEVVEVLPEYHRAPPPEVPLPRLEQLASERSSQYAQHPGLYGPVPLSLNPVQTPQAFLPIPQPIPQQPQRHNRHQQRPQQHQLEQQLQEEDVLPLPDTIRSERNANRLSGGSGGAPRRQAAPRAARTEGGGGAGNGGPIGGGGGGGGKRPNVAIVKQTKQASQDDEKAYHFEFESEDGILRQENGYLKDPTSKNPAQVMTGSWSYTGPDGQLYTINYIADENGFRPEGGHIPTIG